MDEHIKLLRKAVDVASSALYIAQKACEHEFFTHDPYDPTDRWFSSTFAPCTKCGIDGPDGWYCHTSPTKLCDYKDEDWMCDNCIYCGNPQERK